MEDMDHIEEMEDMEHIQDINDMEVLLKFVGIMGVYKWKEFKYSAYGNIVQLEITAYDRMVDNGTPPFLFAVKFN